MHVCQLTTLLLSIPLLALAGDPKPPASWNEIRPSGNILVIENGDGNPYPADSTVEYMRCSPNPYADQAHPCGDKLITADQCLESCKARKRSGQPAEWWCDPWNTCKGSTMETYCRCSVGYWFPTNFPGKPKPTKNVKIAEPAKASEGSYRYERDGT